MAARARRRVVQTEVEEEAGSPVEVTSPRRRYGRMVAQELLGIESTVHGAVRKKASKSRPKPPPDLTTDEVVKLAHNYFLAVDAYERACHRRDQLRLKDVDTRSLARVRLELGDAEQELRGNQFRIIPEDRRKMMQKSGVASLVYGFINRISDLPHDRWPILLGTATLATAFFSKVVEVGAKAKDVAYVVRLKIEETRLREAAHNDLFDKRIDEVVRNGTLDAYIDDNVCTEIDEKARTEHLDKVIDDIIEQAMELRNKVLERMPYSMHIAATRLSDPYGLQVPGRPRDRGGIELEPWIPNPGLRFNSPLGPNLIEHAEHYVMLGLRDFFLGKGGDHWAQPFFDHLIDTVDEFGPDGKYRGRLEVANLTVPPLDIAAGTRFQTDRTRANIHELQ